MSGTEGEIPLTRIFVDGSTTFGGTPNPVKGQKGDTFCSYVILDGKEVLEEKCITLGTGTINQAEYAAIIYALYRAKTLNLRNIKIHSDSSVVVYIINRRDELKKSKIVGANEWTPLTQDFIDRHFDSCEIVWVPRKENKISHQVIAKYQRESRVVGIYDLLDFLK